MLGARRVRTVRQADAVRASGRRRHGEMARRLNALEEGGAYLGGGVHGEPLISTTLIRFSCFPLGSSKSASRLKTGSDRGVQKRGGSKRGGGIEHRGRQGRAHESPWGHTNKRTGQTQEFKKEIRAPVVSRTRICVSLAAFGSSGASAKRHSPYGQERRGGLRRWWWRCAECG